MQLNCIQSFFGRLREKSGRFQRGFRGVVREVSERGTERVRRGFAEWSGRREKSDEQRGLGTLSTMGKLGITGNLSRQQGTHSTQYTHNTQPNLKTNN